MFSSDIHLLEVVRVKIKILEHTTSPIKTVYRAFKICYAKGSPTNIKIPMKEGKVDYKKMIAFIEQWAA